MAEEGGQDKTLEATPRRLQQARERGDTPSSREGASAAGLVAALIAIGLAGGPTVRRVGELVLPLIDQPDQFLELTPDGLATACGRVVAAVALAIGPLFGLLVAGAILPHLLGNSITFSRARLAPKLSNFGPKRAIGRVFGPRGLFEFGKGLLKMFAVAAACFVVAHPLFRDSLVLVGLDPAAVLPLFGQDITALLFAATLVAAALAVVDVPYQHWAWRRRQRMTLQEMREEMRQNDGDPHVKAKLKRLRRQRAQRRMMHDVPKASVVIANPTHVAVALRYDRGVDAAPVVVAKGLDLVAQRIKEIARENGVAVVEDRPLARALHAGVELGQGIPREHFEAVAKIIGLIWAQKGRLAPQGAR